MPLRHWFTEHGMPSWYSWLVVIGGCLTTLLVSVAISAQVNQRALERERAQREQGRASACTVIRRMVQAYEDPPPATETGRNAAVAWRDLGRAFQCDKE